MRIKQRRARSPKEPGAAVGVLRQERLQRRHGTSSVRVDLFRVKGSASAQCPGEQIA